MGADDGFELIVRELGQDLGAEAERVRFAFIDSPVMAARAGPATD